MKRLCTILILVGFMAFTHAVNAITIYRTQRIARVARELHLVLPGELEPNLCVDSIMSYKGHPIRMCTNAFGEVSHVGYRLFSRQVKEAFGTYPVWDFLERYLLECDLNIKAPGFYSQTSLVRCNKGNLSMLFRNLDNVSFRIDYVPRRYYALTYDFGQEVLDVEMPTDGQLMIGAGSREQEEIFERDLENINLSSTVPDYTKDWTAKIDSTNTDPIYIVNQDTYLSKEIRSDLYIVRKEGVHTLLCDTLQAIKSISNKLLTGYESRNIPVEMTIDKYGYVRTKHIVTLSCLISLLKSQGCKLYFGVKGKKDNLLSCTLFALNEELAYDHVFSLYVPYSILSGGTESIKAMCYLYIPLQNVSESFFNQNTKD